MDKEIVEYMYSGMLFSLKEEENCAICDNVDELGVYYVT